MTIILMLLPLYVTMGLSISLSRVMWLKGHHVSKLETLLGNFALYLILWPIMLIPYLVDVYKEYQS